MEIDLSEILKAADLVIKETKQRDFVRPDRAFLYHSFLVPVGWKLPKEELYHYYGMVPRSSLISGPTVIHGHDKWTCCATPHFCHLYGFKPGPEYNPSFRKMFDRKWKVMYNG